ncbi:CRISPR-associated protein Cas4 [Paracraurococcus lichenis]|uniref:Dna2/Cas4 domain-containing protein n=1 Tax=Paracraurococcus lichenis TaxID=3064888 RepID=A0ABT9E9G6_9PROT|nr:PD-(D/E)XK nuclease family protein [Paracraurococcus sp. LOR1-02]MDO9712801.1 Dna2/Cas4 domain-containing protein [Paracraurococcus sp. LOR1-02]
MSGLLFGLAALALLAWWLLRRRAAVLPGGVVYSDAPDAPTLVSHRHRLAGRPDYVVRGARGPVPVEVKSRGCGRHGPHAGERAQLLAYCLLVEAEFGEPVREGLLQYRDRAVQVPFGEAERRETAALLAAMVGRQERHRSHLQAARCRGCGTRAACGEALG